MTLSPHDRSELIGFVSGSRRWVHSPAETADDMVAIHREVLVVLTCAVLQLDHGVMDIEQRLDRLEARFKATGKAS